VWIEAKCLVEERNDMRPSRLHHIRHCIVALVLAAAGLVLAMPANAADITFALANHPDGNAKPPTYGLRLDDLFLQTPTAGNVANPVGGTTTFSFDPADGAGMSATASMVGLDIQINILGTVHGGVDTGVAYGFGGGLYDVDFTYRLNVTEVAGPDGGFTVSANSAMNNGTITAQAGITGVDAGTSWTFYDQSNGSFAFKLLADGHRLGGFPVILAQDPLVGHGWVTFNSDGTNTSGTQDWLFITPEPSSLVLLCIGGVGLFARRRRRLA